MPKELSEKRASDRERMTEILTTICAKHNATLERDEILCNGKQIYLYIRTKHGLSASIDFSGNSSQPDIHVVAWHFKGMGETRLANAFGLAAGGAINQFHRRKCTGVLYGFPALCESMEKCLVMANNDTAFM